TYCLLDMHCKNSNHIDDIFSLEYLYEFSLLCLPISLLTSISSISLIILSAISFLDLSFIKYPFTLSSIISQAPFALSNAIHGNEKDCASINTNPNDSS